MSDPRPPKSPRKGGKYVNIRIVFLNDTVHVFQVPVKGTGALLWDAVVHHLQLLEADYFDLEYTNHHGDECWLEKEKTVLKQLGSPDVPLRFCVKFYTPDPGLLEDELTRFLFALQVRKDLLRGELRCSENTASLLASYVVQAEIGNFDCDEYADPTYLTVFKFVPEHLQNHEFMAKVMDYHRQHIGESPSEADLNLLDTARKVELYGIKMWSAKDHENVSLNLAVAHLGVLVFQQHTKINTFSWAKVRKLSFKRKKFLIKLHADTYTQVSMPLHLVSLLLVSLRDKKQTDEMQRHRNLGLCTTKNGYYKDTVEFFFETRDRCKLFWKRCIEHHAFFRCQMVSKIHRSKSRVVSRGSSFRYNGRTQKQLVEFVRENVGKRPHFERSTSGRISSRSTSVTPKMVSSRPQGMHSSSADLQTSSGSRSSGSHILMESNHTPNSGGIHSAGGGHHSVGSGTHRVESVDVHSDSSMSGSRSLNSPRLEHGLSIDQEVIEAVNARTEGAMTDDDDDDDDEDNKQDTHPHSQHPHRREIGGVPHVASDTKGADSQCITSPELHSPVRYVGLCSDLYSPPPDIDDDNDKSKAETRAVVVASDATVSEKSAGNCKDNIGSGVDTKGESYKGERSGDPKAANAAFNLEHTSNAKSKNNESNPETVSSVYSGEEGNKKNAVVQESNAIISSVEGVGLSGGCGSRSNLELKLNTSTITTTITNTMPSSSSSSALPSSSLTSSSVLTSDITTATTSTTSHHPKHLSSSLSSTSIISSSTKQQQSASSSTPPPSSSTTSHTPSSSATHTPTSKTPSTPSSSSATLPTSASQNTNKKLGKLKSRSLSRETHIPSTSRPSSPQVACSTNTNQTAHTKNVNGNVITANTNNANGTTNVKCNSLDLRRSSSEKTSRQVRSSDTGQQQSNNHRHHQHHQRQSPVCGGDAVMTTTPTTTPAGDTTDLSPPFPPPPPPLTPQQFEEEMRRRSLDASPSSCILDAAAQMQQHHHHHHQHHQQQQRNQQVRPSSISTTPTPSSTPTTTTITTTVSSKSSSIDSSTTINSQALGSSNSSVIESTAESTSEANNKNPSPSQKQPQQQQLSSIDPKASKPKKLSNSNSSSRSTSVERSKSISKDHQPSPSGTTGPEQPANTKDYQRKKHLSNGQAVGAGAGAVAPIAPTALPQRLAPSESSRKLSAGTDLIEDIPYILRRRLDGQTEETAVFKASEAGKLRAEKTSIIDDKTSSKEKDCPDPRRRSEIRNTKPPSDLKLKNVDGTKQSHQEQMTESMKRSSSRSRSPSLTRRVEFFYVNKLPSRNSYSSVDDTASPSKDDEIIKQLELSVHGKVEAAEGSGRGNDVMTSSVDEEGKEELEMSDNQHVTIPFNEEKKYPEGKHLGEDSKTKDFMDGRSEHFEEPEKDVTRKSSKSSDAQFVTSNEEDKDNPQDSDKPTDAVSGNGSETVVSSGHNVEKPLACKKGKEEGSADNKMVKARGSVDENTTEGVQFYSPKIPGTRIFKKVIRTSTSDESPDSVQSPPHIRTSVSSAEFSDTHIDASSSKSGKTNNNGLQYFEVSKPEVQTSKENGNASQNLTAASSTTFGTKHVPKSLSLKTDNTHRLPCTSISHPTSSEDSSEKSMNNANDDNEDNGHKIPISSLHPHKTEPSQFLIDLPSPAAALFYSDSSPPQTHDKDEASSSALTFSTFRPDPSDEASIEESAAASKERAKSKPPRWSLHSPVDIEGVPDFEVVMSEGAGIIEKSALKKRRNHDPSGKPREPKRVSWHDDGDVQYSYLSDVSMTAHRSPVEECDTSSLFSGMTTPVDSGDILETLENLRRQNSESDMTNSGSSVSSSECSDIENEASAKQIYLQYADAKCLSHSSGEGTLESDRSLNGLGSKGGLASDHHHHFGKRSSPLRCLESVSGLSCSGGSFSSTLEKGKINPHDSSPLETLEHLSHLAVNDTFDDEEDVAGEDADDEDDDEPNYPPPPPLMDLPDEMLVSYESDMPLPDFRDHPCSSMSSTYDPLDCLEGAAASSSRASSMVVAVYSSDSDNNNDSSGRSRGSTTTGSNSWLAKRMSIDPLAALELGDLVGNVNCTTSESESDFDAVEANTSLRSGSGGGKDSPSSSLPSSSHSLTSPVTSTSRESSSKTTRTQSLSSQQQQHHHHPPPPAKKPQRRTPSSLTPTSKPANANTSTAPQSKSPSSSPSGAAKDKDTNNAPPLDATKKKAGPPKVLSKPKNYSKTAAAAAVATTTSTPSSRHSTTTTTAAAATPPPSASSSTSSTTTNNDITNTTTVISPRPLHLNSSSSHLQNADTRKGRNNHHHQGQAISPSSPRTPASTSSLATSPPPPTSITASSSSPRTTTTTTTQPPSTLRTSTPPTVKSKPKILSPRQPQMGLGGRHYERMRNDSRSSTSSSSSSLASSSSSVVQKASSPPSSSAPSQQPPPPPPKTSGAKK